MNNIIKLSVYNFKNVAKTNGFILSFAASIFYVLLWIYLKPKAFIVVDYQFEFFRVVNFIILYYSCAALGKEIVYGTSKILFTAPLSRTSVIIEKLLVIFLFGLLYWLCSRILEIAAILRITKKLDMGSIFSLSSVKSLAIYMIISFVLGSFCLMVTVLTLNFNSTLVLSVGVFGILQFFIPLFYNLRFNSGLTLAEQIITLTPNYIMFCWLEFWNISVKETTIMMLWGSLFLTISLFSINRRSIK